MKKLLIICLLLFFPLANSSADDNVNFGFTLGNIGVFYNSSLERISGDVDLLHFSWLLYNRLILGFSIINLTLSSFEDEEINNTILPLEVGFIPFSYNINDKHQLCFSLNGKAGWHIKSNVNNNHIDHSFYGSLGGQLFLQYRHPGSLSPYSRYLSLFAEYNTFEELRAGFKVDLTTVALMLFLTNTSVN